MEGGNNVETLNYGDSTIKDPGVTVKDAGKTVVDPGTTVKDADKTVVESGKTVIGANGIVYGSVYGSDAGVRAVPSKNASIAIGLSASTSASESAFRGYEIIDEFPAKGTEADIYLVTRGEREFVLKLYRRGMNPGVGVLEKVRTLCETFPEHIVKIYDCGYDDNTARWYEIQEHARYGSLKAYLKGKPDDSSMERIITEISEALRALHNNNVLHLDLKPSNILVRSDSPLNLIFTDFGISSILDPELSKKLTVVKGTPLYWSPESFTGVVGKATDWWSLGIIILELTIGRHPFSGLDPNVIMYTLSTKGIEVPEEAGPRYGLLLRGLLTRDPKKRWGYDQVGAWLRGNTDIAVHYDAGERGKNRFAVPFTTQDSGYYSMEDLVESFIESEDSWEDSSTYIQRGYLSKWLNKNDAFGMSVRLEKIMEKTQADPDLSIVTIVYTFNKSLPFSFYGHLVTPRNLLICVSRVANGKSTRGESLIVDNLLSGKLFEYYRQYLHLTGQGTAGELYSILSTLDRAFSGSLEYEKKLDRILFLEVLLDPDKYILPSDIKDNLTAHIDFIGENHGGFITRQDYAYLSGTYIVPEEIKNYLLSNEAGKYVSAVKLLKKVHSEGLLIKPEDLESAEKQYVIPAGIVKDIGSGVTSRYVKAIKYLREIKDDGLLLKRVDYESLIARFIIPMSLQKEILSEKVDLFDTAIRKLDALQKEQALLSEGDVFAIVREHPLMMAYLTEKEKAFVTQYSGEDALVFARNWIRRFASGRDYMKEYEELSRYVKNGVEVGLFPQIEMLESEFAISLEYLKPNIVFDENNSYGETTILKKFQDYTKALKSSLVRWESVDKEILSVLRQSVDGMARSIERLVEQANSRNFILGIISEAIRGALDDSSFSKICFDIYVRYQARIDEAINQFRKAVYHGGQK
ncbi:MAG: protein kinase [Nitrospirae bacterium]|nr:protein kinase [Nitrospirota bacterium]